MLAALCVEQSLILPCTTIVNTREQVSMSLHLHSSVPPHTTVCVVTLSDVNAIRHVTVNCTDSSDFSQIENHLCF